MTSWTPRATSPGEEVSRTFIEHSADGLLVIDSEGIVRFANPAAMALFAAKTEALIGLHLGQPAIYEPVEIIVPSGDGARYVEMRAAEIGWEGQTASLASLRDITDRKRAEEELRRQAGELSERNGELVRFNRVAVGRELRMVDLKREVNELCRRLGEPSRYGTAERRDLFRHSRALPPPGGRNRAIFFDESHRAYLEGLLTGDRQRCREIYEEWLDSGVSLRTLYQDLVQRSLYEVGVLWEQGRLSVAAEHMATAITESLLNLSYPRLFAEPRNGRAAVVACPDGEYHQIGGKMVADLFELNGWRGYFLGANTPPPDMQSLIVDKRPDVVALSITLSAGLDRLIDGISAIRCRFPDIPILIGGQAFRSGGRERLKGLSGVSFIESLADLEAWLREASENV
jgi:methanogenic corrinoid protein MtbC1